MGSFLKTALVLRRLQNVSQHFVCDELNGLRELGDVMPRILPPVAVSHQKHSTKCENGSNSFTIVMPAVKLSVRFKQFQSLLKLSPHPNGNGSNGNDDKSSSDDARSHRAEEVKKLQDIRQRMIDHEFHKESVWKALKERDEILGPWKDKNSKNGNGDDKDEK